MKRGPAETADPLHGEALGGEPAVAYARWKDCFTPSISCIPSSTRCALFVALLIEYLHTITGKGDEINYMNKFHIPAQNFTHSRVNMWTSGEEKSPLTRKDSLI